jgi:hypothetical protein
VYIDTGSSVPGVLSKSCDLADENNKILTEQWKTICLYVYISDIRQIVGYRTPVFIQRFPWRLHITITYNQPSICLCIEVF